ncbi:hypothetical protein EUX98_g2437 [Antrodiella citrinella]|uniref:Peptidase S9 prolyl oligopeptidase catalytic domain-containing protein n=1 Tax=Antrodiella citrinella TaxID=2447956 RepID=A0A4S4N174_9APHY|nr:hypothetical protein EUX98_g2437 [Antrodiella citrinella]
MTAAPSQSVELPIAPSTSEPTSYDLFVSGDYEIRLFGDPIARKSQIPELRITAAVEIDELTPALALEESHHVVPDFVGGWAFGSALGVGLRSIDGWWTITNVSLVSDIAAVFNVQLLKETRLAPSQTRILPLRLIQTGVFKGPTIQFELTAASSHSTTTIPITLTVNHHSQWRTDAFSYLTATFFFATSMPTAFIVIPPIHKNEKRILPPVLALHGAGVDVINMPFFAEALPRQKRSWVVIPAGRTAWGLDWHGPSAQDALATVDSLHGILEARSEWHAWKTEADSRVLLIGHSNGGQGAWYMASRFPDRIIGAIPAAGYIKSQSYVPFVQSRSAHFIDPAVRAILETALTPDDNELFISNLVDTPVLAIHGGDDDNVPVWHTRQLVDVLKTWHPNANVTYQEDPGQPHFYPNMFLTRSVQDFIDSAFEQSFDHNHPADFTLTVAIPSDSGSLHGFRIEALQIPGRLGRLTVQSGDNRVIIKTSNVRTFAIGGPQTLTSGGLPVLVDNQEVNTNVLSNDAIVYICKRDGRWQILSNPTTSLRTPTGRLSNILTTLGSINIVIPDAPTPSALSVAKRIAHDLNLYHKLDTDVLYASEASARLQQGSLGPGNVVVVGGSTNSLAKALLLQHKTPFSLSANILTLNGEVVDKSAAALFLHPHPESAAGLVLLMYADTEDALERAGRLFPIRTGVTVPDWLVIGNAADKIGAAGVLGAGVWGHEWTWNEALSSF